MNNDIPVKPLRKKPVQVLLALSMLFQVKEKIKREDWMLSREIVRANTQIFARVKLAIEVDYGYDVEPDHLYEAVVLLLMGMNVGVAKRPDNQPKFR